MGGERGAASLINAAPSGSSQTGLGSNEPRGLNVRPKIEREEADLSPLMRGIHLPVRTAGSSEGAAIRLSVRCGEPPRVINHRD